MDKAQATAVRTLTRALLLLWATVSGCAATPAPATWQPGNGQPLITGWQRYVEIQWEVARQDRDAPIEGYITNYLGVRVREVRVLVNGHDSSGTQARVLRRHHPWRGRDLRRQYLLLEMDAAA